MRLFAIKNGWLREGRPTKTSLDEEDRLDVPPEERRTSDLVKRIRKLRWIGMEQEAAKRQPALPRFPPGAGGAIR
jgi:hypothetical protein